MMKRHDMAKSFVTAWAAYERELSGGIIAAAQNEAKDEAGLHQAIGFLADALKTTEQRRAVAMQLALHDTFSAI